MEMLVTKFSKGKYRNEGALFAEPISKDNVKLMGEMIALQALRTVKKYDESGRQTVYRSHKRFASHERNRLYRIGRI